LPILPATDSAIRSSVIASCVDTSIGKVRHHRIGCLYHKTDIIVIIIHKDIFAYIMTSLHIQGCPYNI